MTIHFIGSITDNGHKHDRTAVRGHIVCYTFVKNEANLRPIGHCDHHPGLVKL